MCRNVGTNVATWLGFAVHLRTNAQEYMFVEPNKRDDDDNNNNKNGHR